MSLFRSLGLVIAATVFAASPSAADHGNEQAECGDAETERSPWFAGPAPFEHADSGRTHVFDSIHLRNAAELFAQPPTIAVTEQAGFPGVYNFAIREPGQLFLLGGTTGGGGPLSRPYVARLDGSTLSPVWRTELADLESEQRWTYPGAIAVHANGFVYAVYSNRLVKIDPATGALVANAELPAPGGAADTAYNGFTAFSDGLIVLKSHHRPRGCPVDGFRALISCGIEGTANSALAVVDPDSMEIVSTAEAPELIGGRISIAEFEGDEYLYAPGLDYVHRFRRTGVALEYDGDWGPVRYREGQETPGTAVAAFGEHVVVQNNALPSDAPMRVQVISQRNPSLHWSLAPFADQPRSMIPSMPSVDVGTGRIYAVDGLAGGLAALDFDAADGLRIAWRVDQSSFSFSALIGPPDNRILIASDAGEVENFAGYGGENIVWRDAASGRELARSPLMPRLGGLNFAPHCGGGIFYPTSRDGRVFRLDLVPAE